jgi:hypothetical protein
MTEEEQTETTEAQEQQSQPTVSLGLSDLALMANIIQVTSERGAIKANEMQVVGALYTKLVAFVNANAPAPEITSEEATDEESEVEIPEEE